MSVQYTCFVLPVVEDMARSLSADDVAAVLDVLTSLKWGVRADAYDVWTADASGKLLRTTAHARGFESLVHAGRSFVVELPETPAEEWWPSDPLDSDGASRTYEFGSSETAVLEARHCFKADLCWAPVLFSAPPDGMNGSPTPCPACGADVVSDRSGAPEISALEKWRRFAAVPASCPSCLAALDPTTLVMQVHNPVTGEIVPESRL